MKKLLTAILSIMTIFVFGIALTVNAVSATVTLKVDKTEVNPGDTFTVTVSGSCEDGINGLSGSLSYDKNQLELVSAKVADDKWSNLGQNSDGDIEIAIIANSDNVKTADVFKVTFKVKENIGIGTTIKVTPKDIILDSFATENSQHNDTGAKEVLVTVKEKITAGDKTQGSTTTGDKTQGNTSTGDRTQGNTSTGDKTEYKNIENKNATQSQAKTMPYTGTNMFIIMLVVAVVIVAIVSYVSYKRYKNI